LSHVGFGLEIVFIKLLEIITISNYSIPANSCIQLHTTAHTKSSLSSLVVAW
jgi:hypothetical protein